jgi:hypothetical protein
MCSLAVLDIVEEEDEDLEDGGLRPLHRSSSLRKHTERLSSSSVLEASVKAGSSLASAASSSAHCSRLSPWSHSSLTSHQSHFESSTILPLTAPRPFLLCTLNLYTEERRVGDLVTRFDQTLRSEDVPRDTATLLAEMKTVVMTISNMILPRRGQIFKYPDTTKCVKSAAGELVVSLRQYQVAVQSETEAIEATLELAPFTVCPAPDDLWPNYQQMAELIIL